MVAYTESAKLRWVWNQDKIPVALRRNGRGEKLRIRLPYSNNNRAWLQNGRRTNPVWFPGDKFWELPKSWFNDFVDRALERYGKLYVIQPYREQEKCSPKCLEAVGHICECSCMGANHGAGNDGSWFEVNDTFATRWSGRELACRLMEKR